MRSFVAPGKLVLVGEYAVLDGAPALVAAVNRGVRVDVTPAPRIEIETPGDDRFVRPALLSAPPGHYAFSDQNPVPTETKAGFGGSAAATVAAVAARRALQSHPEDPAALFAEAYQVHHAVQGSGSGVDVAASTFGGVIRFAPDGYQSVEGVPSPVVIWSGTSAETGPRIAAYRAWRGDRDAFVQVSTDIVDSFAQNPIQMLDAAWQVLVAMSRASGVDYRTPALDKIVATAQHFGGAAKPSGAGGGDCAIALLPDPVSSRDFRVAVAKAGFRVIPVHIAPGVAEVPPREAT